MNFATRLTMQGLIRTLQGAAHDIAERIEREQAVPENLVLPTSRKPQSKLKEIADGQRRS